nr:hypothetical protein GCM10020093_022110 [Planobispora longispora]
MGVRAPRRTVPVGLVRRLPRRITGADPETLSFISADRYPTASARAFAAAVGLEMPPAADALRAWADDLVAARFGAAVPWLRPYGFRDRTWVMGERHRPAHVLLHGLPMNADLWAPLAARLPGPILAPDLPGLGRSAPADRPMEAWLADLMGPVRTRPVLVAHSLACDPALRFAAEHPGRVSGLVLISPRSCRPRRAAHPFSPGRAAAAPYVRRPPGPHARPPRGAGGGERRGGPAPSGVARRVIAAMRTASAAREASRSLLERVKVPVEIIVGSADPLVVDAGHPVTEIAGAGHYPQLTHPVQVARHLGAGSGAVRG